MDWIIPHKPSHCIHCGHFCPCYHFSPSILQRVTAASDVNNYCHCRKRHLSLPRVWIARPHSSAASFRSSHAHEPVRICIARSVPRSLRLAANSEHCYTFSWNYPSSPASLRRTGQASPTMRGGGLPANGDGSLPLQFFFRSHLSPRHCGISFPECRSCNSPGDGMGFCCLLSPFCAVARFPRLPQPSRFPRPYSRGKAREPRHYDPASSSGLPLLRYYPNLHFHEIYSFDRRCLSIRSEWMRRNTRRNGLPTILMK